jgi:formaldehyde-activating enzyme involved in methanogenesis
MDEAMQRLITRLIVTQVELGGEAYREAVQGALRAVARAVLDHAEREMGLVPPQNVGGPVIPFPLAKRHSESDRREPENPPRIR